MSRKVFLSFLGTNNYLECNYFEEGSPENKVSDVKYVQEALIRMYCQDFHQNDVVLLFLTEKAEHINFWNNGQYNRATGKYDGENEGLYARLQKLNEGGQRFDLKHRRIKEGFSHQEIWSIFDTVADEFQEGDEVIFDITHAFRFLPMLGVVLMNYLKTTKNVKVKGIHYGAFEKLGVQAEVNKLDIKDRNAPVLNLNTLLEFQSWTSAVNSFLKFGEVGGLKELSQPQLNSILAESEGKDQSAGNLRFLIKELSELTDKLQTNRLNQLFEKDFDLFVQKLHEFPEDTISIKPFKQVLRLIGKKVDTIISSKELIWLESAKWCLEHNLIQQAYTQLLEGLITYFIRKLNIELEKNPDMKKYFGIFENEKISEMDETQRTFCSGILYKTYEKNQNKITGKLSFDMLAIVEFLLQSSFADLANIFGQLNKPRNDINHAGMRNNTMKAESLKKKIADLIDQSSDLIYRKIEL